MLVQPYMEAVTPVTDRCEAVDRTEWILARHENALNCGRLSQGQEISPDEDQEVVSVKKLERRE